MVHRNMKEQEEERTDEKLMIIGKNSTILKQMTINGEKTWNEVELKIETWQNTKKFLKNYKSDKFSQYKT